MTTGRINQAFCFFVFFLLVLFFSLFFFPFSFFFLQVFLSNSLLFLK